MHVSYWETLRHIFGASRKVQTKVMRLSFLSLAVCVACSAAQAPDFLLPDDVVPIRHTIELTIDPGRPVFTGHARIEVNLRTPRDVIWINGKDLDVHKASVDGLVTK